MTDDDKAMVERLREMGEHPCRSELPMGEDLRQAADRIEALSAENERLREAQESVLPSLEHYYQIAIENGHPEFIEAAMLALHTAYAALGDEA